MIQKRYHAPWSREANTSAAHAAVQAAMGIGTEAWVGKGLQAIVFDQFGNWAAPPSVVPGFLPGGGPVSSLVFEVGPLTRNVRAGRFVIAAADGRWLHWQTVGMADVGDSILFDLTLDAKTAP